MQSDLMTPQEVYDNMDVVDTADRKEIASFVSHDVFKLDVAKNATNTVDALWVRKWADRSKRLVKSRCCSRGFLDAQKLGMSLLAQHPDWELEAFDISTAFLQGLKFSEIHEKARQLGIEVRGHQKFGLALLQIAGDIYEHLVSVRSLTAIVCAWRYFY